MNVAKSANLGGKRCSSRTVHGQAMWAGTSVKHPGCSHISLGPVKLKYPVQRALESM